MPTPHSIGQSLDRRIERQLLMLAPVLKLMAIIGGEQIAITRAQRLMLGLVFPTENEQRCIEILLKRLEDGYYNEYETAGDSGD
jgi:hypothetical protein